MQPSHASKCNLWCIVGAASGAGVAIGLLILVILWNLCSKSVQLNIAWLIVDTCMYIIVCVSLYTFRKRCKCGYRSIGTDKKESMYN